MKNQMNDSTSNNTVNNTTPAAPAQVTPPKTDKFMAAFLASMRRPR